MAVHISPPEKFSALRLAATGSFVVGSPLFMFVSALAGMRWLGVVMLVGAFVPIIQRRIAYGWEGRAPSGDITGVPAVVLGMLLGALGVAILAQPDFNARCF